MKGRNLVILCFLIILLLTGVLVLMCGASAKVTYARAERDQREEVPVPIIMYHGLTASEGDGNVYFISAKRFEADLIRLKKEGYTAVFPSQLVDYVKNGTKLPEKPIILSFDDGYYNNYSLGLPLLMKYDMKAVISLIGSGVDISSDDQYRIPATGNLNWGEVCLMSKGGYVEFANHTYDLHTKNAGRKGADIKPGENPDDYAAILSADALRNSSLIEAATGKRPVCFAWPYGAYPEDGCGDKALQTLGIPVTMNSYQRTSCVRRGDPDSLLGLGRYLRTPDFNLTDIAAGESGDG